MPFRPMAVGLPFRPMAVDFISTDTRGFPFGVGVGWNGRLEWNGRMEWSNGTGGWNGRAKAEPCLGLGGLGGVSIPISTDGGGFAISTDTRGFPFGEEALRVRGDARGGARR